MASFAAMQQRTSMDDPIHPVQIQGFRRSPRTPTAAGIRTAVDWALNEDKVRTGDLGGKATTRELPRAIVKRL